MKCPICFSDEEEKIYVELPCKHKCCLDCFTLLKKFECMLCRKQLEHLVPDVLKHKNVVNDGMSSMIMHIDYDYYLHLLGVRLRREILRTRLRRLRDMTEVPLVEFQNQDDDLD